MKLDLGDGLRIIDLCGKCQDTFNLPKLTALLDEYGGPAGLSVVQDSDEREAFACPVCERAFTARKGAVSHLQTRHGMDMVAASKAIPPTRGVLITCEVCGFLGVEGPGMVQHKLSSHPEAYPSPSKKYAKPDAASVTLFGPTAVQP